MALISRTLNVYSLPEELLSNLAVRTIAQLDEPAEAGPSKPKVTAPTSTPSGTLSCQSCPNTAFETVDDQRAHFKTDWHRYNAKARIEGKKVVTGEQWDEMAEGEPSPPHHVVRICDGACDNMDPLAITVPPNSIFYCRAPERLGDIVITWLDVAATGLIGLCYMVQESTLPELHP